MRIPNLISLFVFALMSYSLDVSAQTDTVKVFVGGEVFDGDANGERVAWATVRLRSAADSTQTARRHTALRQTRMVCFGLRILSRASIIWRCLV